MDTFLIGHERVGRHRTAVRITNRQGLRRRGWPGCVARQVSDQVGEITTAIGSVRYRWPVRRTPPPTVRLVWLRHSCASYPPPSRSIADKTTKATLKAAPA